MEWSTVIASQWSVVQWSCGGTAVITVGVLVWVVRLGGIATMRDWLSTLHTPQRKEAKEQIKRGLTLAGTCEDREDEQHVDALISGIDQWRGLTATHERRLRALTRCKWLLPILAVVSLTPAGLNPSSPGVRLAISGFWAPLFLFILVQAAPIAALVLEHGTPKKSSARAPGAVLQDGHDTPLRTEGAPKTGDSDE